MDTKALQRQRGKVWTLATACIAMALLSTSCGGGGGTAVVPVSAAGFSVSPSTVTFGNQVVGGSNAAQSATLINVGDATLTFSGILVTGPNAGDYTLSNTCGSSLAPSGQCTLSVKFTPSAVGARTASVVFTDNATGSPQTLGLTGTGTSAGAGLSATTLTFGSQLVGTSTPSQSVILTNNGDAALSITSVAVTGPNSGDFPETTTCGSSLAAGGSCTINVGFTPTSAGSRTAAISVTDSAINSPQMISLTGTGASPTVSLTATSLAFSAQNVATTSAAQSVTLTNTGNVSLNISGIAASGANPGDFTETTTCGDSVAAGGSCTIAVAFTPGSAGSRSASVTIKNNASGSPHRISLTGTGVGTAAVASLSTNSLPFGSQSVTTSSTPLTVTLTNTGNATLNIASIGISGANATDFSVSAKTCGSTLVANGTCTISVTFTPTGAGSRSGTLVVTDDTGNVAGSTQNLSLTGTGTASTVSFSATILTFASQTVGTPSTAQALILTNTGNASLSITSLALTGVSAGDFGQINNCGSSVAANGSCTITVTFKPAAIGSRTASISITDNAGGSPQTVSLTGTGSAPMGSVTPTSLAFNGQNLGTTSVSQAFTLNNTGNAALSISSIAFTGANPGDFAETTTCGSSLPAGGSCTFSVTFTPSAAASRSASLTITDNSNSVAGSQQSVTLTGTGTGPSVSLSASTLPFGSQTQGTTSATQSVTLTNTGNASLTITSISVTGKNAGDFGKTTTCPLSPASVAAGGSCTITVTFTPSASGSRTASISIADNATGSPQAVSLIGAGASGSVGLSATVLTFGSQSVGTTTTAQVVTLTNGGTAALTISSIQITGTNPADFGMPGNTCGSSLAVNVSCTVNLTFTPTTSGSRTATLTFTDNATNSPQTVTLTGTGTAPLAGLSPTSFAFLGQPAATSGSPESFTLSNTGTATLTIAGIGITGPNSADFIQNTTCGTTLAAGATCTIAVSFTPAAAGSRSGTLVVTTNNNVAGNTQLATLTGTGLHDVILTWTACPNPGILGYEIHRGTTSGGESATPLNSAPLSAANYVDTNVTPGTRYYYVVTAVASDGTTRSAPSTEASTTVPSL